MSYFREVTQNFELKRVGRAPKGHQFVPPGFKEKSVNTNAY